MDELAKTEMRNYATAAGFLLIATMFTVFFSRILTGITTGSIPETGCTTLIVSITLLILGVMLIAIRNRDLSAITFLMLGMMFLFFYINPGLGNMYLLSLIGIAFILLAVILLTTKDKTKYLLCLLPLLIGIRELFGGEFDPLIELRLIITAAIIVLSVYFAFAVASERIHLPLGKILKADVTTDFKASGSVLGYLLFALSTAAYAVYYFTSGGIAHESVAALDIVCGSMLIVSGVLLFAVAKMRFTPVMFILLGFLIMVATQVSWPATYGVGIMIIILGLFAMLRTESRILPGLMLILYGLTGFTSGFFSGGVGMPIVQGIMNLIPCLIAVYLAFAVFSQSNKLKLF